MKLKVLLVSRNAWDNKAGNTYSNFFQEFKPGQLAQVYCRDELPDNELCENYFCISENKLIKSLFSKQNVGAVLKKNEAAENIELQKAAESGNKLYGFFRNHRFTLLLWLRELIWLSENWKSEELDKFIREFNPDVIYTDAHDTFYTYRVLHYVRKVANAPYVMFHADDHLTYRKFSLSPLFWINRFMLRQYVKKAIKQAAINYCIIDEQRTIYNRIVPNAYKILNKCADFSGDYKEEEIHKPVKMIYAGNLHLGRWKTLQKLAEAIKVINKDSSKIHLDIYTGKSVTEAKLNKIKIDSAITLHDFIPYEQLIEIQKKSDILLHVESFDLKEKLLTFLSFSTKIVDFFEMGKCILAIGWKESAPIKYLLEKDAAVIVSEYDDILNKLNSFVENPEIIREYSRKSYNCGKAFHSKEKMLGMFKNDLIKIAETKPDEN
ncbi:glycosyltransferase family protein [Chryseobacterium salivictor]|uniref:Uncharacterized protein n=1 Tax=Chryseobacterium salivictor TaxID=2547600 RepID=A0A4V1ALG5_9FLAO|nr:hypothetical protein [Chryseobacterium salivictor]QBO59684.1 hypothetical protein NBC122_02884 [Chryseobacterium salivictor]